MKTQLRIAAVVAVVFLSGFLASCGGGSGGGGGAIGTISVAISPSAAQRATEGAVIAFTATVTNDPSNAGVTWTLTGAGALSNITATSATYTAPPSITAQSIATVTAKSVTDISKSASTQITLVAPPPVITTTSLPNGTIGGAYSATIMTTGGALPLTFSITSGALPAGLTLSPTTGTISGVPTTGGTSNFTVTVTDSSNPVQTASANLSIVVNAATQLMITTTSLPDGTTGVAYSAQIMTSGGVPPITFSLTSGSLPDGLTLSSSGLISGTPTGEGTSAFTVLATDSSNPPETAAATLGITITPGTLMFVTTSLPVGYLGIPYSQQVVVSGGVPPYTFSILSGGLPDGLALDPATGIISGTPTDLIGTSFMIKVRDSDMPFQSQIKEQLKIGIDSAGTLLLNGQYAFQAAGFDPSNNPVVYAGTFTADAMGNITGGIEDTDDNGIITSAIPITGIYVVASDNRGTMTFNLGTSPQTTQILKFAMNSTGQMANLIQFDSVNQTSGTFQKQDSTAFSLASLAGDYAFGLASIRPPDPLGERAGQVGRFTVDSSGNLSAGAADTNDKAINLSNLTLTGSFGAPDSSTGRGTATLTPGTQTPLGLTYYIVQQGLIFSIENDANSGDFVYSGSIIAQQGAGSFSATSLSGPVVFEAAGVDVGGASVIAGQFTATPSTLIAAGELDENDAGLVKTATFTQGTYSVGSNGRGTISMVDSNLNHFFDAVFYLTGPNTGFILDAAPLPANNFIRSGMMQPQTGSPFTSAPNDGEYYGGSFAPATAGPLPSLMIVGVPNIDDQFNLTAGALSGLGDISDINLINILPLAGTYTFGDSFGRATLNVPVPGFGGGMATIYLVSPTQFVMIPTNQFGQASDVAMFQAQ